MRIVYVLTSLGVGGTERLVLALADRMAKRGHAVTLMVLRPQLAEECSTALDVVHLDMRKSFVSFSRALLRARSFVDRFQPDVVHSHGFHANIFARLLKLLLPRLVVVSTIHNVYEGGWQRMLAYRLTDGLSANTTAVSSAAAERFVQLKAVPRSKCLVLTNGIDASEFSPDAARRAAMRTAMGVGEEFVWLAAGRVVPAKDYPNLLRAFSRVRAAHTKTQLWIAGAGDPAGPKQYSVFAVERCLVQQARWLGLRRDMPPLLNAADGFVLASAWEGMPLALGEAMAVAKPVVATDVGGVRELVGDAGEVVVAGNAEALAVAMLDVMSRSAESRQRLGDRARKRIQTRFSMDARVDEWEALYQSLTRRS
jgi:glycosyltransferase involved in cell wall biosynthesis